MGKSHPGFGEVPGSLDFDEALFLSVIPLRVG